MLTIFMFRVTATTSIRRGRGKNKNKRLKELTKNGPIDIEFEGQERYPSGDNAGFFPRLIGEVLSDHCDLHHDSWTEVPSEMVPILKNHVKVQSLDHCLCVLRQLVEIMSQSFDHYCLRNYYFAELLQVG
jgi:hypothetical protein